MLFTADRRAHTEERGVAGHHYDCGYMVLRFKTSSEAEQELDRINGIHRQKALNHGLARPVYGPFRNLKEARNDYLARHPDMTPQELGRFMASFKRMNIQY